MPNYSVEKVDYAWVNPYADNPWGFIQQNDIKNLFYFYFDPVAYNFTP